MLIGNYSAMNRLPMRFVGGATVSDNRANFNQSGMAQNRFAGETWLKTSATPNGYGPGDCWIIARSSGGMGSNTLILGAGTTANGNLAGGLNAVAPLTGTGGITLADLALIVSAVAALSGTGVLTGDVNSVLAAVAALTGAGNLTGALGALASLLSNLTGTGEPTAGITAKGFGSASIVVTGDALSTANVGDAVLDTLADGSYTVAEVLRLMAAVLCGKSSGGPGSPVFRDLDDSKTRLSGTADSSGNRTAASYDPD